MSTCPTCRAVGFDPSILGPDRCSFCDGTEGGHPPDCRNCGIPTQRIGDGHPHEPDFQCRTCGELR